MKNLYIDFDGVMLNTVELSYKMIEDLGLNKADEEAITLFYESLDWKKLLENATIINDSINCLQKILDSNKFNVAILTHVVTLQEAVEKVNYIRQYFKDITIIPVPKKIHKTKMVQTKGAILVDDYTGNLIEWEKEDGIGVKFSIKLSSKGFIVIDRLDQLLDIDFNNVSVSDK